MQLNPTKIISNITNKKDNGYWSLKIQEIKKNINPQIKEIVGPIQ